MNTPRDQYGSFVMPPISAEKMAELAKIEHPINCYDLRYTTPTEMAGQPLTREGLKQLLLPASPKEV